MRCSCKVYGHPGSPAVMLYAVLLHAVRLTAVWMWYREPPARKNPGDNSPSAMPLTPVA